MKRIISVAVALALIMAVAPSVSAAPAQTVSAPVAAAPSSGPQTQGFSSEAAAKEFWTPARMAAAIPQDAKVTAGQTTGHHALPSGIVPVLSSARTDMQPALGSLRPAATEAIHDPMTKPYTSRLERLNGKVFFTQNGGSYVCSGTVVNSENKDLIDTAGHCVNSGTGLSGWSSNVVFVPGYNPISSNPYPFGIWSYRYITTTWEWYLNGNFKEDLGYIVLKPLSGRGHIANYLGAQGVYFNVSRTETFDAFGYPQAAPYNGTQQRVKISRSGGAGDNPWTFWAGPHAMKMTNSMTGGSSGGAWLVGVSGTTGLGHVNGHNDYKYVSGPKANTGFMYSPYYGPDALFLFNYARHL